METLMADFRLDDLGAIEFKEFGEETNVALTAPEHTNLSRPSCCNSWPGAPRLDFLNWNCMAANELTANRPSVTAQYGVLRQF